MDLDFSQPLAVDGGLPAKAAPFPPRSLLRVFAGRLRVG
jgi:hypothetical protein